MRVLRILLFAAIWWPVAVTGAPSSEAITFASDSKRTFLPLGEAAQHLRWKASVDDKSGNVTLNGKTIPAKSMRSFTDGKKLISLDDLAKAGAVVSEESEDTKLRVKNGRHYFTVSKGSKRAEVNLAEQRLRAWEGQRLVLETRISSGKRGRTPSGSFRAGPYKARKHYSSRYDNAYMPYSVQVTGHIFIHGYKHVPDYPASHGCIRLPYLTDGNPARFFYEWIDKGTPIKVRRK